MKAYTIFGRYYETQADAKGAAKLYGVKFDPETDTVEIPIVKAELIEYLNKLADQILDLRHAEPDPDRVVKDINDDIAGEDTVVAHGQSYTERSVGGDDWFQSIAVEHQLTLTQLALENARNEIGRLKGEVRGGIEKVSVLKSSGGEVVEEPLDDELFG